MKFLCPSCKAKYQLADEKVSGRSLRMKCRKCGQMLHIAGPGVAHAPDPAVLEAEIVGTPEPPASGRASAPHQVHSGTMPAPPEMEEDETTAIVQPKTIAALAAALRGTGSTPSPAAEGWFVGINGVPVGPIRLSELRSKAATGAITLESLTWREGCDEWRPLKTFPELALIVDQVQSEALAAAERIAHARSEQTALAQTRAAEAALRARQAAASRVAEFALSHAGDHPAPSSVSARAVASPMPPKAQAAPATANVPQALAKAELSPPPPKAEPSVPTASPAKTEAGPGKSAASAPQPKPQPARPVAPSKPAASASLKPETSPASERGRPSAPWVGVAAAPRPGVTRAAPVPPRAGAAAAAESISPRPSAVSAVPDSSHRGVTAPAAVPAAHGAAPAAAIAPPRAAPAPTSTPRPAAGVSMPAPAPPGPAQAAPPPAAPPPPSLHAPAPAPATTAFPALGAATLTNAALVSAVTPSPPPAPAVPSSGFTTGSMPVAAAPSSRSIPDPFGPNASTPATIGVSAPARVDIDYAIAPPRPPVFRYVAIGAALPLLALAIYFLWLEPTESPGPVAAAPAPAVSDTPSAAEPSIPPPETSASAGPDAPPAKDEARSRPRNAPIAKPAKTESEGEGEGKLSGDLKNLGSGVSPAEGPRAEATATTAAPAPQAELGTAQLQSTVARYTAGVKRSCWQPALETRDREAPNSARVNVTITISPSGSVQDVSTSGDPRGYPGLANCIAGRVRGWQFPASASSTTLNVPFVFAAQ